MSQQTQTVLDSLNGTVNQLYLTINSATTPSDVRLAASTEYIEVSNRLQMLLGMAIGQEIANLTPSVASIATAQAALKEAAGTAASAKAVLDTSTQYLTYVDNFIDLLKPFLK